METIRQSQRRWKMCSAPVSQLPALNTPTGLISIITVGILLPARVLAKDLTKTNLREGSPNLLQMASKCVGKQATSEMTDSHSAGGQGGTKNNQAPFSKPKVLTTHSSGPGSSGGASGGSGRNSNKLRQEASHLAPVIFDDDEFANNPHQIMRMPLLFLTFLDRISKGLTGATFYQQRSPLEFKHCKDTRPLWRMAFFSYLNRVWEWVQVTSDHVANHYTLLAHAYATAKTSSQAHPQVLSIAPPTECSLAVTLPYT